MKLIPKIFFRILLISLSVLVFDSCSKKATSCGNEVHVVKSKRKGGSSAGAERLKVRKAKGGKKDYGIETHKAKTKRARRGGSSTCGNERHVAKRRKMKKKDMGLWGKGENPYARKQKRR